MHRYLWLAFFSVLSAGHAQILIIPQIADGGGWQTTLVLTNTTTSTASASLSFYQDTGGGATQTWNLSFLENVSTQNLSLPGGRTLFLHTPATNSTTSVGWAQLQAPATLVAYAIFTQRVPGRTDQDGTAPAAAAATRILAPFDNTANFVTAFAVVNPTGSSESIGVNFQTDTGAITNSSLMLPAQGHMAFALAQQFPATSAVRGLAEFYVSSGSFSILALRFNPTGGFTASPVYAQTGSPIIGSGGGGAPAFSSLTAAITFEPNGGSSGQFSLTIAPNANGINYTATEALNISFINGTLSNSGQTFTFNSVQAGVGFFALFDWGANSWVVSSASMTLTLQPNPATPSAGAITGSLTITGAPYPGGGAAVTLSGPINGAYTSVP